MSTNLSNNQNAYMGATCGNCYNKRRKPARQCFLPAAQRLSSTSRRSQPPLALAVPLSRFTPRVGGGSAFYVRRFCAFFMKRCLKVLLSAALLGGCPRPRGFCFAAPRRIELSPPPPPHPRPPLFFFFPARPPFPLARRPPPGATPPPLSAPPAGPAGGPPANLCRHILPPGPSTAVLSFPNPTPQKNLTQKGVLLRSEAEPANTPLVEQAR